MSNEFDNYIAPSGTLDFDEVAVLVKRTQKDDQKAFAKLYDLYFMQIYYMCVKYLSDVDDAAEATQDVFVQVHKKVKSLKSQRAFHKWIHKIAYSVCMNRLAKRKRRNEIAPTDVIDTQTEVVMETNQSFSLEDEFVSTERMNELLAIIDNLPAKQRETILLRYVEGFSIEEIAEITDSKQNAIHKRLSDAKKALLEKTKSQDFAHTFSAAAMLPLVAQGVKAQRLAMASKAPYASVLHGVSSELGISLTPHIASAVSHGATQYLFTAVKTSSLLGKACATAVLCATLVGGISAVIPQRALTDNLFSSADSSLNSPIKLSRVAEGALTTTEPSVEEEVHQVAEQPEAPSPSNPQEQPGNDQSSVVEEQNLVTLVLPQVQLTYYVGEHPTQQQVLSDLRAYALDQRGNQLPVQAQGYNSINFAQPGTYRITVSAQGAGSVQKSATATIVIAN